MRECPVCGDNDYEELAGHFYCTTCNTQSQHKRKKTVRFGQEINVDVRVEVVDTDAIEGWTGHADVIREKKTPSGKRKKAVVDKGQPWSIYEAYQIILLHQVEALIQLGARQELKDIVFKLWANYLAHLGVAFTDKGPVQLLKKYGRQRELFPGTTKKPLIKNILGRNKRKRTIGVSAKQAQKEMERELVAEALRDEQFEEGDNPLDKDKTTQQDDSSDEEEEEDMDIDDDAIELELLDNNKRRALHSMSIYKMQMTYTVALCYLGLMVTNPLTTVVDMVRWIKQEKLPYLNVKHLITDDMKFCCNDWKLFGEGKVPTLARLRWAVSNLGRTLNVSKEAIEEFPFRQLIHKYIVQLDLPAELHQCVSALHRDAGFALVRHFRILSWEVKATAIIIVLLKLIFGVNDHSERIFSQYSKELNTLLYGGRQQLFVWDKWLSHVNEKINLMDKRTGDGDIGGESDISERLGRRANCTKYTKTFSKLYNPKTRDAIQKPFLELTETWKAQTRRNRGGNAAPGTEDKSVCGGQEDDGIDLAIDTLLEEDPVGYLLGISESEEGDLPPQNRESHKSAQLDEVLKRGEVFRQSSLQHILKPDTFLDNCIVHHINDTSAARSSCSVRPALARLDSQVDSDVSTHDILPEDTSTSPQGFDKAKYKSLIEQCVRTKKHYLLAVDPGDTTPEAAVYSWLLHLCSKFIYCTPSVLQAEVNKIERRLCV